MFAVSAIETEGVKAAPTVIDISLEVAVDELVQVSEEVITSFILSVFTKPELE